MKRWVIRGGTFVLVNRILRTTDRDWYVPESRSRIVGFRVVIRRKR